jgi:hypothetical protein
MRAWDLSVGVTGNNPAIAWLRAPDQIDHTRQSPASFAPPLFAAAAP